MVAEQWKYVYNANDAKCTELGSKCVPKTVGTHDTVLSVL